MGRRRRVGVALLGLLPSALTAQSVDACPDGRPRTGDVGIRALACEDAEGCGIWGGGRSTGWYHWFSVEPMVTGVAAPDGAIGRGDRLVSVDGVAVTSAEGGRLLANLPVGRSVTFVVRRGGARLQVDAIPVAGCGPTSISVTGR